MRFKSFPLARTVLPALILVTLAGVTATGSAQSSANLGNLQAYEQAVTQASPAARRAALERFVAQAPNSTLRTDAVAILAWLAERTGDRAGAERWAHQLSDAAPGHPLALAVVADADRRHGVPGFHLTPESGVLAMQRLPHLAKPEGMSNAEFQQMRLYIDRILAGATGYAFLERQQYVDARPYLRRAAGESPGDVQYAYGLAVADLSGADPIASEGYWYLARTVDLTRGTARGQQIAAYARNRYEKDGGTGAAWDGFLMAAAKARAAEAAGGTGWQPAGYTAVAEEAKPGVAPHAAPAPSTAESASAVVQTSGGTAAIPAATANPAPAQATNPHPSTAAPAPASRATTAAATEPSATTPGNAAAAPIAAAPTVNAPGANHPPAKKTEARQQPPAPPPFSTAGEEAVELPPSLPPIRPQQRLMAPGAPVSIGVLLETGLTAEDARRPVVGGLVDMARHLRPYDQAFLISFDRNIIFDQDLTSIPGLLEDAAKRIKPHPGTALLDAITFAAFHMGRMAKNQKRVLIVVSDGENANRARETAYPLDFATEVRNSGVAIYCIGLGVTEPNARSRLQQLAQMTGGQAMFVSDPQQVRGAAHEIASRLGIWP